MKFNTFASNDEFYRQNEIENNIRNSRIMFLCAGICLFYCLFLQLGVWDTANLSVILYIHSAMIIIFSFIAGITMVRKGKGAWIKWMLLTGFLLGALFLGILTSSVSFILLLLPVVLSYGYYYDIFTIVTALESAIAMICASIIKIYVKPEIMGDLDVRYICLPENTTITFTKPRLYQTLIHFNFDKAQYLRTEIKYELIPVLSTLMVLTGLCLFLSRKGKRVILNQRKDMEEKASLQVELEHSRTTALLSQIRPHFIFNILNSVYGLCDEDPELAKEAIEDFSDYLRMNVDALNINGCIAFSRELEHIESYMKLEQLRYGDRVNVIYDIQTENFRVPPLSIQPLVENAVKHGICQKAEGGTVEICTYDSAGSVIVTISDDGVGFDLDQINSDGKNHVGIENSKERLRMLSNAELKVKSEPGKGTVVTITIP